MNFLTLAKELGIDGVVHGDEFRARCPMHHDRSPSFSLNIETGLWVCFSKCGKGNFVHLVERVNNCTFGEAHEWLRTNGMAVSTERQFNRLETIFNPFVEPVQRPGLLWKHRFESLDSNYIPTWFLDRGFTWDTINHWAIKYDPALGSVVIPVYWQDQLVGTIDRHTNPNKPKYENSPELPKEQILFGEINPNAPYIILTEGALDPIWTWQNGLNCIGLLGLYLSNKQIELLKALRIGEIVLGMDNDEEGRKATNNLVTQLTGAGWMLPQLTIMQYPEGKKDPNDCTEAELDLVFNERTNIFKWSR